MAKAVADTNGDELQGGYASDNSNITGFSHLHDSGTGGVSFVFLLLLDELRCVGLEVVMGYVDGITEKWYFLVHITYLG